MKLTESELKQIIKEEIDTAIEEGWLDRLKARASGVGSTVKDISQRASGAAKYAATGEAPSTAGKIGGSYNRGKKMKIIDLHKKKIEKLALKFDKPLEKAIERMKEDVEALGIEDSQGVMNIIAAIVNLRIRTRENNEQISKLMGKLRLDIGSEKLTQEE